MYQFGDKIKLDSFLGLEIDDVTQLRIGVFGSTGSGKSCFINTVERVVRQTNKGSVPDQSRGNEGTIVLQDYLPELFFHLVDTRGFFKYDSDDTIEFQNGNFSLVISSFALKKAKSTNKKCINAQNLDRDYMALSLL